MFIRIIFLFICLIFISLIIIKYNDTYQIEKYKISQQTDSVLKVADSIYVIIKDKDKKFQLLKEEIIEKQKKENELIACSKKQESMIENLKRKPTANYFEVVSKKSIDYSEPLYSVKESSAYREPLENKLILENEMLRREISILKHEKDSILSLMPR
jgi:predicted lactoylglutathione lyase